MAQSALPSNPFDGFDNYSTVAQQPPQQQQQRELQQQQLQQQQQPPNQWAQQPTQPVVQQQQQQQLAAAGSPNRLANAANPFAAPAAVANNANPFAAPAASMAMVPLQQQPPNQWAQQTGMVQPQQQHPRQQQIVPMAPNATVQSPWALQPVGGAPPSALPTPAPAADYDPLGIFGAPTQPVQPQNQFGQQPVQQQFQAQQQQFHAQQHPYAQQPVQQPPTAQQKLQEEVQEFNLEKPNQSVLPEESEDEGLALIDVELDDDSDTNKNAEHLEQRKKDGEFFDKSSFAIDKRNSGGRSSGPSWDRNPDIAPPPPLTPGRNHAEYLARNSAPALSSPLPKYELVHHSGHVLSRISFRTVLMRKWKQTFWIQYGPTQLLFFRTFADYEDWLNNPYHTIKGREFLVKLRVDFVSDLKKSSVMGYQVTQVRRKPYGKNVMLHFKLERWMDYGPTIAAAFAAREEEMMNSPSHRRNGSDGMNTSNDVAALRKIVLGCMRNARDAALVASREHQHQQSDMGEAVGYRGRYDAEHERDGRIPSGTGNIGYHQAFSAESSERRRGAPGAASPSTESSQDEVEEARPAPVPVAPVVDLLG